MRHKLVFCTSSRWDNPFCQGFIWWMGGERERGNQHEKKGALNTFCGGTPNVLHTLNRLIPITNSGLKLYISVSLLAFSLNLWVHKKNSILHAQIKRFDVYEYKFTKKWQNGEGGNKLLQTASDELTPVTNFQMRWRIFHVGIVGIYESKIFVGTYLKSYYEKRNFTSRGRTGVSRNIKCTYKK